MPRSWISDQVEYVHTGDQLESTSIQNQTMKTVVFFSFKDDRKPYFGQFTDKHIKENMAIILDGKVDSAPVINSKIKDSAVKEADHQALIDLYMNKNWMPSKSLKTIGAVLR